MKTLDQPFSTSPLLDHAGIRAYASYFAIWFIPALFSARLLGFVTGASGATHATLYSMALMLASHQLLQRFFFGQRRIVQFRERHRLAAHCSGVTAISTLLLGLLAARIGLVSFSGDSQRAAENEAIMLASLPVIWALDYLLFRLMFSDVVQIPLLALWRRRHNSP